MNSQSPPADSPEEVVIPREERKFYKKFIKNANRRKKNKFKMSR